MTIEPEPISYQEAVVLKHIEISCSRSAMFTSAGIRANVLWLRDAVTGKEFRVCVEGPKESG